MLIGAGRLLFHAFRVACAGARRRVQPIIVATFAGRRMRTSMASFVLTAMVGTAFAVTHGFGPATPPRLLERPRSVALPEAPASDGSSSVTVESGSQAHQYAPGTLPAVRPSLRRALLIGINHAVGGRPLQGAVTDALNVKQALLEYGFPAENITTLLDGQATRAAILKGLDDLGAQTSPDGIAVLVIASHSRQYGGIDQILAADGNRVDSTEIASRMQRVKGRAWIALPTCFAGGYALPGIVGPGRIATFASSSDNESYEVGTAGSYLIIEMVKRAMIDREAPYSVESAFEWAKEDLERTHPYRVPSMSDGIDGELVLGYLPPAPPLAANTGRRSRPQTGTQPGGYTGTVPGDDPSEPAPTPPPRNRSRTSVSVCGRWDWNCQSGS